MSVERIKQVEIIRGPGSALYGANAFVAVINIISKEAADINGLQVTAGGGNNDTQYYNVLFGHEDGKFRATGFLDYLDTDGPSSFIEQDAVGVSGNTLNWQERPDVGLSIAYGNFMFRGGYLRNKMGPVIGATSALNDETVQDWGQYYGDLIYKKDLTDQFALTARLYGDLAVLDPYWELFSEGYLGIYTDGLIGNPASKHRKVGAEITTDYSIGDHFLTLGALGENINQFDIDTYGNFNALTFAPKPYGTQLPFNQEVTRDIWALYAQDVWNIRDNLSLTAGLRYDHYSDFGGTINPRIGMVWEFQENTTVKVLYGSAFRAPSFAELYHANNPSLIGNPNLQPEEIKTYEIGLEHRFHEKYTLRVNCFDNRITDIIVSGPNPPAIPLQYINSGKVEVKGLEAELTFDFGNSTYGYVNYSYQDPRDGDTGQQLPDVASHKANAGVNFAPWEYLNANLSLAWIDERPRDDGDMRGTVPEALTVDMTLIFKNFWKTMEIRGSVYNIFNEDYRDPGTSIPGDIPTNERTFMVEARYTY